MNMFAPTPHQTDDGSVTHPVTWTDENGRPFTWLHPNRTDPALLRRILTDQRVWTLDKVQRATGRTFRIQLDSGVNRLALWVARVVGFLIGFGLGTVVLR